MKFCPWCRKPLMFPMYGCDFCKLFQPASGFSREEIEDDERQNGETMNRREALQALPALGLLAAAENTERIFRECREVRELPAPPSEPLRKVEANEFCDWFDWEQIRNRLRGRHISVFCIKPELVWELLLDLNRPERTIDGNHNLPPGNFPYNCKIVACMHWRQDDMLYLFLEYPDGKPSEDWYQSLDAVWKDGQVYLTHQWPEPCKGDLHRKAANAKSTETP